MAHPIELENMRYHRIMFLLLSTWHDRMAPIRPTVLSSLLTALPGAGLRIATASGIEC